MDEETLRLVVRTPQGGVFDERVTSLRVPTDTGQVGLRPRSEEAALVVEPGLALAASSDGLRFVATAGGLLRCDGVEAVLLTPLAVVGDLPERELGTGPVLRERATLYPHVVVDAAVSRSRDAFRLEHEGPRE